MITISPELGGAEGVVVGVASSGCDAREGCFCCCGGSGC